MSAKPTPADLLAETLATKVLGRLAAAAARSAAAALKTAAEKAKGGTS